MRFAVAKQQGLSEELVSQIDADYQLSALDHRQKLAVAFADHFLGATGPVPPSLDEALAAEFTSEQLGELAVGMSLFHGFSKLMIALGCEPEQMDTTELPTPDVRRAP